ncbi:potassium/proton antiporter [Thiocapsa sp. UBA6158]|jgi:cell volume regulation protein A|uniref:potassium/proton antiporter n=1 Tax=Thiocapsa sp. UBA6158 TaxID=1947692 RepID=UPI0025DC6D24|nr:potassium/proton antiporter [Thiocapsa sp. UBA6158]
MTDIDQFVLIAGALLLVAILASALSYRIGMPLLLVFLAVGMLAGEDGPGGIVFNDVGIAYAVGSVTLAVILLDGGLNTRSETFRTSLRPAFVLATLGVVITCVVVGLFAAWLLDLGLLEGLLVGAVVGSTDAAAVFALLRARGLQLKERVTATLEMESGSNDPMAVFLTIAVIELLVSGHWVPNLDVLPLFVQQMGMGLVAGIAGGYALDWLTNRLSLERGMYPLLILAGGLAVYGLTTVLGGSGFLAIYLIGVVLRHRAPRESHNILQVHDGFAWLAQIAMFLMLGLLATPTALIADAPAAFAIALALMFVARPIAVAVCLIPFRFPWREQLFIAWVGLRGAVPIILALFPLLAGIAQAELILDLAFFVVLISLTVQGWTIPRLARRLRLEVPAKPGPDERLELTPRPADGHAILGYHLGTSTRALGRRADELHHPGDAWAVAVLRDGRTLMPEVAGPLTPGDWLYLVAKDADSATLGDLLVSRDAPAFLDERVFYGDFILNGSAPLGAVAAQYGQPVEDGMEGLTLEQFMCAKLDELPVVGDRVRLGKLELVIRDIRGDTIHQVGLRIPTHLQ